MVVRPKKVPDTTSSIPENQVAEDQVTEEMVREIVDDYLNRVEGALYVVLGGGKRGKTTFSKLFLELAALRGRSIAAMDLETVNPGLSAIMKCEKPKTPIWNGAQLAETFFPLVKEVAISGKSRLLDFEGSDDRLIDMARQVPALDLMRSNGVPLIAIGVVAGGTDDLVTIDALGHALDGAADALIIVVNEALLPSQWDRDSYEEHIGSHEGIQKLGGERVTYVWMPPCPMIRILDNKKLPYATIARDYLLPKTGVDDWMAGLIDNFFRKMIELCSKIVPCAD